MQDLEEEIIKKLDFTVSLYYRYADDTILFIPKDKINNIVDEFNKHHERLKFTFEIENNNSIPFLNILIIRNNDNTIFTNWYRENTFSGRFLNYFSNHPIQHKIEIKFVSLIKISSTDICFLIVRRRCFHILIIHT